MAPVVWLFSNFSTETSYSIFIEVCEDLMIELILNWNVDTHSEGVTFLQSGLDFYGNIFP